MGMEGVVGCAAHVLVSAREDLGFQEVFASNTGKGRQPCVGMSAIRAVVGEEVGLKEVPNAP